LELVAGYGAAPHTLDGGQSAGCVGGYLVGYGLLVGGKWLDLWLARLVNLGRLRRCGCGCGGPAVTVALVLGGPILGTLTPYPLTFGGLGPILTQPLSALAALARSGASLGAVGRYSGHVNTSHSKSFGDDCD
jgi:hypothetical protein